MSQLKKVINTERLTLVPISQAHADVLFTYWSDDEVTRYMNIVPMKKIDEARQMIEMLDQYADQGNAVRYALVLGDGQVVGSVGLNAIDTLNDGAEIGYDVGKPYWRQGYGKEALNALINFAFDTLQVNRLEAKVIPDNMPSLALLEKLGFEKEGCLREKEKTETGYSDLYLYSLLRKDQL
ncbi:GNAT family N-acetyltransferase [Bacillaceae bacterium SIJ1]|uniref:GNAT family N-acetyltransferase n=1 Tax=Litoribacterium kuwaitense TaxID=1398745 RepID=UPI0013EAE6C1|nr:GNAT family protein [Litoribacterium kuwaitense]NGP45885.1 GNAT family N-acetyltransferase [Litoribacterium kuwaitense]